MTYSIDLRKKVLKFVSSGGTQLDAAKNFGVNPKTIYCWQRLENITPKPRLTWHRKIHKNELIQHVNDFLDMILRERAAHFGVHINAIWGALRRLKIRKKNHEVR